MTFNERNNILKSEEYIGRVRIAFYDWLQYWATVGTENIQDEQIRENTNIFIKMALSNPEAYVNKLAVLSISETAVKEAIEITDVNVQSAIDHLLATALEFLL